MEWMLQACYMMEKNSFKMNLIISKITNFTLASSNSYFSLQAFNEQNDENKVKYQNIEPQNISPVLGKNAAESFSVNRLITHHQYQFILRDIQQPIKLVLTKVYLMIS